MLTQLFSTPTLTDLAESLSEIPEDGVFLVATDYKETVTVLKDGYSGTAKLGKKDDFNLLSGIKAALLRWAMNRSILNCREKALFVTMNQSHVLMAAVAPSELDRIALDVARNVIASKQITGYFYMGDFIDVFKTDLQVNLIGTSI